MRIRRGNYVEYVEPWSGKKRCAVVLDLTRKEGRPVVVLDNDQWCYRDDVTRVVPKQCQRCPSKKVAGVDKDGHPACAECLAVLKKNGLA